MKLRATAPTKRASPDNQPVVLPSTEPEEPNTPEFDPVEIPDEFPFIKPVVQNARIRLGIFDNTH